MQLSDPSPAVFSALLSGNIKQLCTCSQNELRPFLPCLTRMVLCSSSCSPVSMVTETNDKSLWEGRRKAVFALISGMEEVNAISKYLAVDFHELKQDAIKEQQLLRKLGPGEERGHSQSILASSLQFGLAIEFERCDHIRRFRLFLSEILCVLNQLDSSGPFKFVQSDLFECEVHLEEICDIMCIAVAELSSLLPVVQLCEALLRLEKGPHLLARLIANMPDSFDQVVSSLILNGESLDEVSLAGRCRTAAIKALCSMHPSRAAMVQSLSVANCKHPTLALSIALEAEERRMSMADYEVDTASSCVEDGQAGVVTLLHNIIIAGDEQTRAWFAQYLKCMQQKYRRHKSSAVTKLRWFMIKKLRTFSKAKKKVEPSKAEQVWSNDSVIPEENTGTAMPPDDQATVQESSSSMEVGMALGVSESVDTLEDLVDQMEIEISDHGEDGESEEAMGEESLDESPRNNDKQVEKKDESDKTGEKVQSSTTVSSGGGVVGKMEMKKSEVHFSRKRRHSSTRIDKAEFPPISLDNQLSDDEIIELMELLQVCCALKTQTQMYLKDDEAATILSLIACTCPPFSRAGIKFIEVTLCVLLACPFLISMEVCETAVVHWLKWLLDKLPVFNRTCDGHCPYGELLLLIAIHLKEKQLDQIEELIAETLNMKVSSSLRSGHFSSLSKLFLQVFTEDVICSHAMRVSPTEGLTADMTGYLPVHCIHQLIKMRTFRKHGVPIKDWIYRQLLTLSEPLHPTLPLLIQEFVNSVLLSAITPAPRGAGGYGANAASNKSHSPFTDEEVLEVFRVDSETQLSKYPIPSQILMIYYVLLYHDCYLSNLRALMMRHGQSTPRPYGHSVVTQIPLKRLSDHARRHPDNYSTLYPTMLKLMATQFPQLCLVCEWLTEKKAITATKFQSIAKISSKSVTPDATLKVLKNLHTSPSQALLFLTYLSNLPSSAIIPYRHAITSTFHLLLDPPSVSRRVQALYVTIWTKINNVTPRKLWLETINALRPLKLRQMKPFTHKNLAEDPLTVLRCDKKVFRCPPVFDILLRILSAYTAASKSWLHEHAYTQNCIAMATPESLTSSTSHVTKQERDELCIALTAAQESAIIQLLLEICLPTEDDKKDEALFGPQVTVLQEIRCLVCSYFHHTFICDPPLVKLVHFQGYPTELLPMMVSGVPSMHICLDFIPELLAQPQTEKQQFGVQLASHVIEQYPLPDAMGIAKDIFKRLMVLTNEIPASVREQYFLPVLPSVVKLASTFPPLCKEAADFLVQLSKTCGASLSSKSLETSLNLSSDGGKVFYSKENGQISKAIEKTFEDVVQTAVVKL